jgi:hypothetical protein
LTYNATSLILPTSANITCAIGDVFIFESLGSGNWKCIGYTLANGQAIVGGVVPVKATGAELDTGTDDAKFATAKALKDSHNVPSVVPSTSGNILFSNGLDWISNSLGAPDSWMRNGKIVPSVASNNLTVALKNKAGNNPSATDPVTVTIGGVVRTITAALSVTKNAATNWFNAGSSELATKEIDYFVYLGYNTSDGVVIGFSRIPYANIYSDFSATTTNEKYAGISTITNATAGDNYVNIGRFAATLSAGGGYTWTVPTFTTVNLSQQPTYQSRTLSWLPTVSSSSGTYTSITTNCHYQFLYDSLFENASVTVVDKGTASGAVFMTVPFAIANQTLMLGAESSAVGFLAYASHQSAISRIGAVSTTANSLWTNTYVTTCTGTVPIL